MSACRVESGGCSRAVCWDGNRGEVAASGSIIERDHQSNHRITVLIDNPPNQRSTELGVGGGGLVIPTLHNNPLWLVRHGGFGEDGTFQTGAACGDGYNASFRRECVRSRSCSSRVGRSRGLLKVPPFPPSLKVMGTLADPVPS